MPTAGATTVAGTADQVALAILGSCEIGVTEFHLHGFETAEELAAFGRTVAPLVRRAIARHDAHKAETYADPTAVSGLARRHSA